MRQNAPQPPFQVPRLRDFADSKPKKQKFRLWCPKGMGPGLGRRPGLDHQAARTRQKPAEISAVCLAEVAAETAGLQRILGYHRVAFKWKLLDPW